MNLLSTVRQCGGIAQRDQLLTAGFPPAAITAALRTGELTRIRRAWFGVPETPLEHRIAIGMGGRVGGMTALRSYGVWAGEDRDIHVSWPPHGNVARLGRQVGFPVTAEAVGRKIVSHWRILRDTEAPREPWRESAEQSIAQALISDDRATSVAVLDSALHVGAIAHHQLPFVFSRMPQRVLDLRDVVDARADSGLESILRLWLWDQGLAYAVHPEPCGLEVDLLVGRSLVIEADGAEFHSTAEAFERDRHRDSILSAAGYIVLRFSYQQIMHEWPSCVARVRAHLARGDHLRSVT